MQMGFFINHLTLMAGLLFAAVHGPGRFALGWRAPWKGGAVSFPNHVTR